MGMGNGNGEWEWEQGMETGDGNLFSFSLIGERIYQQVIAQLIGDPRYLRVQRPYPRRRESLTIY